MTPDVPRLCARLDNAPTVLHAAWRDHEPSDSFFLCMAEKALRKANHALCCGSPEAAEAHMAEFDRLVARPAR